MSTYDKKHLDAAKAFLRKHENEKMPAKSLAALLAQTEERGWVTATYRLWVILRPLLTSLSPEQFERELQRLVRKESP